MDTAGAEVSLGSPGTEGTAYGYGYCPPVDVTAPLGP